MSKLEFQLFGAGDQQFITVYDNEGRAQTADETHPNFTAIRDLALADDPRALTLFDLSEQVANAFTRLSDRVSVKNGRVYLDNDEMRNKLTEHIIRTFREGSDVTSLVNFYEKILSNPQAESREQAYNWLDQYDFTIAEDGDIVGYKGVNYNLDGDGVEFFSTHSGPAIVDGVDFNGYVPNQPGSIIEMPRTQVVHDPSRACSVGLHVGTPDYAFGFGAITLEVRVNPRDIVSVPRDHSFAKVRCCRYKVIGPVTRKYEQAVLPEPVYTPPVHEKDQASKLLPGLNLIKTSDSTEVFTHPKVVSVADFNHWLGKAKRRKRNPRKYIEKHTPWEYVGPADDKDAEKNSTNWQIKGN